MGVATKRDRAQIEARCQKELDDVRSGLRKDVSTVAAAHYLGIHASTLSELRMRGIGPKGSVANTSGASNARVRYTIDELDMWNASRTGSGYKEVQQRSELAKAKATAELLALELELQEARAEIARLRKKMANRGLAFAALPDLFDKHDWVMDDEGAVVGHVLTVSDSALASHWEGVTTLSLHDALRLPWSDEEARALFFATYLDVLANERKDVEQIHRAFVERIAIRRVVSTSGGSN
jgi:HD-GYP domain-containing protein (c-di-GMP phosphodiesterase class II)